MCVKHRLISPTPWLALETIDIIWFLGLGSLDMVMPISFWLLTDFNGTPPRVYHYLRYSLILRTTHLLALKFSSHSEDQAPNCLDRPAVACRTRCLGCESTLSCRQQTFCCAGDQFRNVIHINKEE